MLQTNGVQSGRCFRYKLWQRSACALYLGLLLELLLPFYIPAGFAQVQRDAENPEGKWDVLTNCRLMTNQVVDGDSFHVMHQGKEYYFRLYAVDAPESDLEFKDRVEEQAVYFGISQKDVLRLGELAARFTREKLGGRDFTIRTRWQNGLGRGKLVRFYCFLYVDGAELAEALVANGLARIHGTKANLPGGQRSAVFTSKLKNLELTAREKGLGVHDRTKFPLEADVSLSETGTNNPATPTIATIPTKLDINSATYEELQKLPDIGPKLAERIMAHRPFETLKDLDAVPGIGPVTIKRLEPLIFVGGSTR
jgi:competence ComEA-like helix-hairpin-helix protein